jgi:hypothetical protein
MSTVCRWLHQQLADLDLFRHPFALDDLPYNAIYFFYEQGEIWGHGEAEQRIVRVGTTRDGNFRSRMNEHFLVDGSRVILDANRPAPKDRSIFRKNIGRALLNQASDGYLRTWDIDFTKRRNRDRYGGLRDIRKETRIESEITAILRERFGFRFLILDDAVKRMGSEGLESRLISTVANCQVCQACASWLGNSSPVNKIRDHGLWQVQHLVGPEINDYDKRDILRGLEITTRWLRNRLPGDRPE